MRNRNRNIFIAGLLALFLAGLGATRISAQDINGTIVGLVKDAGGAVVAGATVMVRDTDKNVVVRTVTTNSQGAYTAPLLLAGHYSLTVEASGFKKFIKNNIEVNVNDRLTVDASLEGMRQLNCMLEGTSLPRLDMAKMEEMFQRNTLDILEIEA